ncbi:MAG: hypothetical protein ACHP79_15285 [Terriglobales bacterium]
MWTDAALPPVLAARRAGALLQVARRQGSPVLAPLRVLAALRAASVVAAVLQQVFPAPVSPVRLLAAQPGQQPRLSRAVLWLRAWLVLPGNKALLPDLQFVR